MRPISSELRDRGFFVQPNFLSKPAMEALRGDFSRVETEDGFSRAGTGQGAGHAVRDATRLDSVHWWDRQASNPAQDRLWKKVDAIQRELNRSLFLNIDHFEGHYASYPTGGFYQRHLDCFREDDARQVSFALYLNKRWQGEDGGRLRIHEAGGSFTDIDPVGGTMVCFTSRDTEHEVMESFAPRASFTGWFKVASR